MSHPTPLAPTEHAVAALGSSWSGAGVAPETLTRVAGIAQIRDVPAGTELTREGLVTEAFSIAPPQRGTSNAVAIAPGATHFLDLSIVDAGPEEGTA